MDGNGKRINMTKKRISFDNLPARIPLTGFLTLWLTFDRFKFPEWAFGALYMLAAICFCTSIYNICTSETVDIFKEKS